MKQSRAPLGRIAATCLGLVSFLPILSSCEENSSPDVLVTSPARGQVTGQSIPFSFRVSEGGPYTFTVYTDKGDNPFDGNFEQAFNVGTNENPTITLNPWCSGFNLKVGVRARDTGGNTYDSDVIPISPLY